MILAVGSLVFQISLEFRSFFQERGHGNDGTVASAVGYAVVFGLNNSLTMTLFAFIWPRFFGLAHLGSIQGIGQMIGVVGASLGALPIGIAFDLVGSYDETLRFFALQPAICLVLAFFLRPPPRPERS